MKSSLKFRHKANNNNKLVNLNYRNYHKTINANKTIVSRQLRSSSHKVNVIETWKLISMYIALIIILGLLALLTQQGGYYFNILLAKSSPTISDIVPVTLNNFGSKDKQQRSSGQNIDDSWKLGLYTNRTLGRDYDPLLIVYDTTLKTSVNYSSRLLKETIATSRNIVSTTVMSNNEDLMFHSCTGTTLRHYCRIKSSQLLQDLTFMAHMSMVSFVSLLVVRIGITPEICR